MVRGMLSPNSRRTAAVIEAVLTRPEQIRILLDSLPLPIFLLDQDLRVLDANRSGLELLRGERGVALKRKCGEVFRCVHALESPGGCGTTEFCQQCGIRSAVEEARRGGIVYRKKLELTVAGGGSPERMHVLVTAVPVQAPERRLVLAALEDVSDLVALQGILPICSYCKRIRRDDQYWEQVESYFKKNLDLRFTHGICPECMKKHYPDQAEAVYPEKTQK